MSITFMEVIEWAEDMGIQDLRVIHNEVSKLLGADVAYRFEHQLRNIYMETEVKPSWSTSDLIKYLKENKNIYSRYIYF